MKKISILSLILILFFFACKKEELPAPLPPEEPEMPEMPVVPEEPDTMEVIPSTSYDTLRYLALGDSYTIGESVAFNERFPIQLQDRLAADTVQIDTTIIIAQTGWRTDNLQNAILNANPTNDFNLVSLLIGVNNQFQGRPVEVYRNELAALIDQAVSFAGGRKERVIMVSIPDWSFTPFGQNFGDPAVTTERVALFNEVKAQVCDSIGVTLYNITPISQQGLDMPELVANDGLHPSGVQYGRWVDAFYEDVLDLLKQ
ncbi:MAG: SGNH/GDSL hydrolase family protein [Bacteroidota bacterium]